MNYKNKLHEQINQMLDIANECDITDVLMSDIEELKNDLDNFKIYIPLVGAFNAGKSSLINKYLSNKVLPTEITPETSLAAEIKYGTQERVVAHKSNGNKEQFNLENISGLSANNYKYLEVFQNNQKLQELSASDIVLVDMPGLDSGIQEHNQAIFNYIKEGVYYIVLTEVDQGLQGSVLNFLQELNIYDMDFSIVLTKIDHKIKDDIDEVVAATKDVSSNVLSKQLFVGTTSTNDNDIDDLDKIINNIDREKLIDDLFNERVVSIINKIIRELDLRIQYQSVDTSEIDRKIMEIKSSINDINTKIDQEEKRIEREFSSTSKNNILGDVRNSLSLNVNRLVDAAQGGKDVFNRTVNDIIRPIITKSANENITVVLNESFENVGQEMDNVLNNVTRMPSNLSQVSDKISDLAKKSDSNAAFKKIIGGLAIITNVVAPWLETIFFFLPDIISLFVDEKAKIREKINNEVIPQTVNKLDGKIGKVLQETREKFIKELREDLEEKKQALTANLNKVKEKRENKIEEFDNQINSINGYILKLQQVQQAI